MLGEETTHPNLPTFATTVDILKVIIQWLIDEINFKSLFSQSSRKMFYDLKSPLMLIIEVYKIIRLYLFLCI